MKLSGKIKKIFIFILGIFFLQSCVYDRFDGNDEEDDPQYSVDKPFVTLKIRPVSTRSTGGSDKDVTEKIKTLRVIMLNETQGKSYIEFNKLVDFTQNDASFNDPDGLNAKDFVYIFTRATVPGTKKFYLIANESSVSKVNFKLSAEKKLPEGISQNMSLRDLLKHYVADYSGATQENDDIEKTPDTATGEEFEMIMNSVYFAPTYPIDTNNDVFLPYTAFYQGFEIAGKTGNTDDGDTNDKNDNPGNAKTLPGKTKAENNQVVDKIDANMYLVPVATKFTFNFYNYRKEGVQIENIKLKNVNTQNYLNAQLRDGEKYKELFEKDTWWIDWLAECTRLSQSQSNHVDFNELWGWIDGYSLPIDEITDFSTVDLNPDKQVWTLEALEDKDNPDKLKLGPFYFPESRWLEEKEVYNSETGKFDKVMLQCYSLDFFVHETLVDEVYESGFWEITNLKSLFRATHTIINIYMYESQVEIYAQIEPWDPVLFKGYVQQEDD